MGIFGSSKKKKAKKAATIAAAMANAELEASKESLRQTKIAKSQDETMQKRGFFSRARKV